jgi:hypothetical protein
MRSGWPHSGDGQGMQSADQRHAPFGPDVSWPTGYSDLEYRDGDYRYDPRAAQSQAAQFQAAQPPAEGPGRHPYAAFDAGGYGDDGYSDPGYQGPSAQDAGIAGTRTVRGFIEAGQGQSGYAPDDGYAQSSYLSGYERPGYAGSSYTGGDIELAYPAGPASADAYRGDLYQQPWDYDQPLRYDGEEEAYPAQGGYQQGPYQQDSYRGQHDGAVRYQPPAFDPAAYNGSDYSMPGVNGPGYDLAGIIGTSDFEAIGYDEPSYGRLAYDDPRYEQPRYDGPRFDETRLDNLWLAGDDVRREAEPVGYGNDGFGETRNRSGYSSGFPSGGFAALGNGNGNGNGRGMSADTRFDMKALSGPVNDHTRFDVPAFDDTRLDNLLAAPRLTGPQRAATAVLAPPAFRPRNWAEDTSLDHFADLDLTDEPVPSAFTRTLDRPGRLEQDDDAATRRSAGRRRGRSGDRRQWMALGAIAVVAAGAIGGVLMKYVFSGPSGPAHQVAAPQTVDGFTRSANLEKQMHVGSLAQQVSKASSGQASSVVSAVYEQGQVMGVGKQVFMFVGGKLAGADPAASVANFEEAYKGAVEVSAGPLGGKAACTETHLNGQTASMCVWFDNDTFGTVVSPSMTTAKLATTMDAVRPSLELLGK